MPSSDTAYALSVFVGLWVMAVLYGVNIVLYSVSMYNLLYRRLVKSTRLMIITATILFVLATSIAVTSLVREVIGFVYEGSATAYRRQIWQPIGLVLHVLYPAIVLVADSWLMYRCYIVWNRNWKVILLPGILNIVFGVSGGMVVSEMAKARPGENVFGKGIAQWGLACFALTFTTNILVTLLIAGRLWWASRDVRKYLGQGHSSKYYRAIILIVESGAIYSSTLLILLVLYAMHLPEEAIVWAAVSQIVCLAPTLIIVRAGLGIQPQDQSLFVQSQVRGANSTSGGTVIASAPHHRMAIIVNRDVESDASDTDAQKDSESRGGKPLELDDLERRGNY